MSLALISKRGSSFLDRLVDFDRLVSQVVDGLSG